jgi:hypothetical protein
MTSTFLYKLLKQSKWAFAGLVLYVAVYFTCMYKKMDMAFFPYNNMYSNTRTNELTCYYLKINNQRISYTHFMYWKKDFLEQSVTKYADYLNYHQNNYLSVYINEKVKNKNQNAVLKNALTPGKVDFKNWANWYATYAGMNVQPNDDFELVKYKLQIKNGLSSILDSIILCSTKTENDD